MWIRAWCSCWLQPTSACRSLYTEDADFKESNPNDSSSDQLILSNDAFPASDWNISTNSGRTTTTCCTDSPDHHRTDPISKSQYQHRLDKLATYLTQRVTIHQSPPSNLLIQLHAGLYRTVTSTRNSPTLSFQNCVIFTFVWSSKLFKLRKYTRKNQEADKILFPTVNALR